MSLRRAAQSVLGYVAHKCSFSPSSTLGGNSQSFLRGLCISTQSDSQSPQSLFFTDSILFQVGTQQRLFTSSIISLRNINVEIQSMGESITEGTIAEILKQTGDSVAEDETIAQIETDKVTIDIKAPKAGKIAEIRMQADDTVKVGQVVAVIAEGEGGESKSSGSSREEGVKPSSQKDSTEPSESKSSPSDAHSDSASGRAHNPSIEFPQRMTSDGKRISLLSSDERQRHQEGRHQTAVGTDAAPQPASPSPEKRSEPRDRKPWYPGKEQGTKLSQSRVLSQREMEQIELGGADP